MASSGRRARRTANDIGYALLAGIGLLIFAFPVYWMVRSSLITLPTFVAIPLVWVPGPDQLTLESYRRIWSTFDMSRVFATSLTVAGMIAAANILADAMAAYAFARISFPGRDIIFALLLATLMIGSEALLIPQFLIIRLLGLYNTFAGIMLPGFASAFGIFLLRQFFSQIPHEIEESAFIDGASRWSIFWSIVLPISTPALATIAILFFLSGWEMYLWPLVVTDPSGNLQLIQVIIAQATLIAAPAGAGAGVVLWPDLMAGSVLAAIPILLLFVFGQRYFVRGLTGGAIKG